MKKEGKKNKWVLIIIIVVVLLILIVAGFFILKQNNFSFTGFNFGNGFEGLGKSGNAFEDVKLNPFSNLTG